jgi:hypothetical protein
MRRILIDHARGKRRVKRGGERRRIPLDALDLASRDDFEEIVSVDEAVRRLQGRDERLARLVELRFYAGLSAKETAEGPRGDGPTGSSGLGAGPRVAAAGALGRVIWTPAAGSARRSCSTRP